MSKPTPPEHERRAMGARLKQARERLFRTQAEAAKILDINLSTLKGYEVGTRAISRENILLLSKALRVSTSWLEWGLGTMTDELPVAGSRTVPVVGLIGSGGTVTPDADSVPEEGLASVEIPFPLPQSKEVVAFMVEGDGMLPAYRNGDVLIASRDAIPPNEIGSVALVMTQDGRRYLKSIRPGRKPGRYTLHSFNAVDMDEIRIASAHRIVCWVPADQAIRGPAEKPERRTRKGGRSEWIRSIIL